MNHLERLAARLILKSKFTELYENAFEDFFHKMMETRDPSFVGVRTAGRLGDQGADAISLHGRKVYACYGPQVFRDDKLIDKFESDLEKALLKRGNEFDTFVFTHNDLRGMHPRVATAIATARDKFASLKFEQIGFNRFASLMLQLSKADVEDLLGIPLHVQDLVLSPIEDEITELLDVLAKTRLQPDAFGQVNAVPDDKMEYNGIEEDARRELVEGMKYQTVILNYYENSRNATEQDEVALNFKAEYNLIKSGGTTDPEQVIFELEQYVLGNGHVPPSRRRAADSILAHFFSTCDIFEEPPPGWQSSAKGVIL